MGLVTNEQEEKRPGEFIKLEDKDVITLYSNLFKTQTHFIKSKQRSVICKGEEECYFCKMGHRSRPNYFYNGNVSGSEGTIQMPASVFYSINEQERLLGTDKRQSQWIVSKKGSGMKTEYAVARGKDVSEKDSPITLEAANLKIEKAGNAFVLANEKRYDEYVAEKLVERPEEEAPTEE